jgi:hypothetical protein
MRREDLALAESPVFSIPIGMIEVPHDRLRSLKEVQAAAIGAAIAADRQYAPISVAQLPGDAGFVLVDGLHRLVGMRDRGATHIDARIVAADRVSRRREEIVSAWARAGEDVFDRGAQIEALVEIARSEDASAIIALSLDWDEATAEALGVSRRTLFNYLRVHRHYSADDREMLRGLGQAGELVPLLRLAALPPSDFESAMLGFRDGTFTAIAQVFAPEEVAAPTIFKKKTDAYLNFLRTKATDRQRAMLLMELRAEYHDDGQRKSAKPAAKK